MQIDIIERGDPLFAVFGQNLRRATFKICFYHFVAVRSFTADRSLLQPTEDVKITPYTSIFSL